MADEKLDLRTEYDKIKKQYSLPDFEKIEKDFEIIQIKDNLKDKNYTLRLIRRQIVGKIVFFSQIIERILYPNAGSLILINESKYFTDEQKTNLYKTYKSLMKYERISLALDISNDETENAKYINDVIKLWPKIRDLLNKTAITLSSMYDKEDQKEEGERYFG